MTGRIWEILILLESKVIEAQISISFLKALVAILEKPPAKK